MMCGLGGGGTMFFSHSTGLAETRLSTSFPHAPLRPGCPSPRRCNAEERTGRDPARSQLAPSTAEPGRASSLGSGTPARSCSASGTRASRRPPCRGPRRARRRRGGCSSAARSRGRRWGGVGWGGVARHLHVSTSVRGGALEKKDGSHTRAPSREEAAGPLRGERAWCGRACSPCPRAPPLRTGAGRTSSPAPPPPPSCRRPTGTWPCTSRARCRRASGCPAARRHTPRCCRRARPAGGVALGGGVRPREVCPGVVAMKQELVVGSPLCAGVGELHASGRGVMPYRQVMQLNALARA